MEGGKSNKMRRGLFSFFFLSFFFFFFFFCFSLFKTTKICFGSTKMGIFYQEKSFHAGKKSGKITLPPFKSILRKPLIHGLCPRTYALTNLVMRYPGFVVPLMLVSNLLKGMIIKHIAYLY